MSSLQMLLVLTGLVSIYNPALSQHIYIAPDNANSSVCQDYKACFTIEEIVNQTDLLTGGYNLTLTFLPGEHMLPKHRALNIQDIDHVTLTGQLEKLKKPAIILTNVNITLSSIFHLMIEGLNFTQDLRSPQQSLNIIQTSEVHLRNCIFSGLSSTYIDSGRTSRGIVQVINSDFYHNLNTAIHIRRSTSLIIQDSFFVENFGFKGGAVAIHGNQNSDGSIRATITNSHFISNHALYEEGEEGAGGALHLHIADVMVANSTFIDNHAGSLASHMHVDSYFGGGGAIYISYGTNRLWIVNCIFTNNSAQTGGGIKGGSTRLWIVNCIFTNNSAQTGGGINGGSTLTISESTFTMNTAKASGAALFLRYSDGATMINTSITENTCAADSGGAIHLQRGAILTLRGQNSISNNNAGSIYAFSDSRVYFNGPTKISNNIGGGIHAEQSQIYLNTTKAVTIINNTATSGGGIFLKESTLYIYWIANVTISNNTAGQDGGGIYAFQSTIEIDAGRFITDMTNINNNIATTDGGGICAIASIIELYQGKVYLESNTALRNGGGISLQQNSKLNIKKRNPTYGFDRSRARLVITNNMAEHGGGIHVRDDTAGQGACRELGAAGDSTNIIGECFIQTINLHGMMVETTYNTIITGNTASKTGNAIYGGLLDRCTVSSSAELYNIVTNGLEYIKQTVVFSNDSSIHSDPLQVIPCDIQPNIYTQKGKSFRIKVMAIDQVGNPVSAKIVSSVITQSGVDRLKEGQDEQTVGSECTGLEYNVFSQDSSAQVELYADGPCTNLGPSKLTFNVTFLPCTCPLGFQPSQSRIECICECDTDLKQISSCFPEEETIQLNTEAWIGVANTTNETGYIIHDCPFDYCVEKPFNISLNSSQDINRQCAYNRSGVLCGECDEGLSLVFASTKCKECSSVFLLLLIPFAVAGVVLIIFILWLNITTATGSIYGLIFYANMIAASKSLFLPFKEPNFLTVFISWVNLDLGIETCFYEGMSSQAKVLLQLAFPAYLLILILLIIILCKYSDSFAKLLSNRNPVATLCTVLLLSYSKLLRFIIAALQFTVLAFSDGSHELVWLYDANVPYYSPLHTPRFIAAAVILITCVLFTTLLFFGQWFSRCSNLKIMKWTKNTKYIGFMDAFHAPFKPHHRYWVGLLLSALIVQNIVAAMASDIYLQILSAGCIAFGLTLVKLVNSRIYIAWTNDVLDSLFILNVAILSIATFFISNSKYTQNGQFALGNVSLAIAFFLFVLILCYHFYKYVLKKNCITATTLNKLKNSPYHKNEKNYPRGIDRNVHGDENTENDEEPKIEIDLTPRTITTGMSPDQLREPALDILAPITIEDYKVSTPKPQAVESECTHSVVEIKRAGDLN